MGDYGTFIPPEGRMDYSFSTNMRRPAVDVAHLSEGLTAVVAAFVTAAVVSAIIVAGRTSWRLFVVAFFALFVVAAMAAMTLSLPTRAGPHPWSRLVLLLFSVATLAVIIALLATAVYRNGAFKMGAQIVAMAAIVLWIVALGSSPIALLGLIAFATLAFL